MWYVFDIETLDKGLRRMTAGAAQVYTLHEARPRGPTSCWNFQAVRKRAQPTRRCRRNSGGHLHVQCSSCGLGEVLVWGEYQTVSPKATVFNRTGERSHMHAVTSLASARAPLEGRSSKDAEGPQNRHLRGQRKATLWRVREVSCCPSTLEKKRKIERLLNKSILCYDVIDWLISSPPPRPTKPRSRPRDRDPTSPPGLLLNCHSPHNKTKKQISYKLSCCFWLHMDSRDCISGELFGNVWLWQLFSQISN